MLEKQFGDKIEMKSNRDQATTGNFEITVNGTLVHSKATKGHGFFHTNANQQKVVFDAVEAAMKK